MRERCHGWLPGICFSQLESHGTFAQVENAREERGLGVWMGHEFSFGPLEYRQFLKDLGEGKAAAARRECGIEGFKICERLGHV